MICSPWLTVSWDITGGEPGQSKAGEAIALRDATIGGKNPFIETNLHMKNKVSIICVAILLIACACSKNIHTSSVGTGSTNIGNAKWNPKHGALADLFDEGPKAAKLAHDIQAFYDNVHKKNWSETYNQREKLFRDNCSKSSYLDQISKIDWSSWELIDYEVLTPVQTYDDKKAFTVCKFIESSSRLPTYSCVIWTLEDGLWRCDCAGPEGIMGFTGFDRVVEP